MNSWIGSMSMCTQSTRFTCHLLDSFVDLLTARVNCWPLTCCHVKVVDGVHNYHTHGPSPWLHGPKYPPASSFPHFSSLISSDALQPQPRASAAALPLPTVVTCHHCRHLFVVQPMIGLFYFFFFSIFNIVIILP